MSYMRSFRILTPIQNKLNHHKYQFSNSRFSLTNLQIFRQIFDTKFKIFWDSVKLHELQEFSGCWTAWIKVQVDEPLYGPLMKEEEIYVRHRLRSSKRTGLGRSTGKQAFVRFIVSQEGVTKLRCSFR